jgi:GT2 family glycosyltransferase
MLSIITAVHNLLPMNRLFWEYLQRYTALPFELIIIDNDSTDGSDRFFEAQGQRLSGREEITHIRGARTEVLMPPGTICCSFSITIYWWLPAGMSGF